MKKYAFSIVTFVIASIITWFATNTSQAIVAIMIYMISLGTAMFTYVDPKK